MGRFAINLKRIRKDRGVTQDELAKAIGVSRSAIGMYESGAREPDYETLEAIADFFNVTMDDLGRSEEYDLQRPIINAQESAWLEDLRNDPELRMLLSASSKLNEDDIKYLIALAERMNRE